MNWRTLVQPLGPRRSLYQAAEDQRRPARAGAQAQLARAGVPQPEGEEQRANFKEHQGDERGPRRASPSFLALAAFSLYVDSQTPLARKASAWSQKEAERAE